MTKRHTHMAKSKIAITLDERTLERVDRLVASGSFASRSEAIQVAVVEKLQRIDRTRLATECAKLDPAREKAMAEEGLGAERDAWPEY